MCTYSHLYGHLDIENVYNTLTLFYWLLQGTLVASVMGATEGFQALSPQYQPLSHPVSTQGAIALCEMVEFYGCASKINLAHNHRLRPRAWLTIGRTLKKVSPICIMQYMYMSCT